MHEYTIITFKYLLYLDKAKNIYTKKKILYPYTSNCMVHILQRRIRRDTQKYIILDSVRTQDGDSTQ